MIGFIYISDEFPNGPDRSKNMAARGGGAVFLMWLERNLVIEHYRSHIFSLIIVKLSQYIGFIDFLDKLENGSDRWNTLFSSPDCSGEVLGLVFVCRPSTFSL